MPKGAWPKETKHKDYKKKKTKDKADKSKDEENKDKLSAKEDGGEANIRISSSQKDDSQCQGIGKKNIF